MEIINEYFRVNYAYSELLYEEILRYSENFRLFDYFFKLSFGGMSSLSSLPIPEVILKFFERKVKKTQMIEYTYYINICCHALKKYSHFKDVENFYKDLKEKITKFKDLIDTKNSESINNLEESLELIEN